MVLNQKEQVWNLKAQWKDLWGARIDDKVRAEGIASADYSDLFVEKGTIIYATRDFKQLNFKTILELNNIEDPNKFIVLTPQIGGWRKFIKDNFLLRKELKESRGAIPRIANSNKKQQLKQNGRGWLHK